MSRRSRKHPPKPPADAGAPPDAAIDAAQDAAHDTPCETAPSQPAPKQIAPDETAPQQTAATDTLPIETAAISTDRIDAAPHQAVQNQAIPRESDPPRTDDAPAGADLAPATPMQRDASTDAPPDAPPDADRVPRDSGIERPLVRLTGAREPRFQVVIRRSVRLAVHNHGQATTDVEICGVLVGGVHHDKNGPYLLVHGSVPGQQAANKETQVTFTAETWTDIQAVMDRDFPEDRIVGWYHTHPGFGIFLSGMDLFIQENFFNLPWQIALVYDPLGGDEGVFVWRKGKSERSTYLIEEDAGEYGHDWRNALPPERRAPASDRPVSRLAGSNAAPPRLITLLLVFLVSFALMFLMMKYLR